MVTPPGIFYFSYGSQGRDEPALMVAFGVVVWLCMAALDSLRVALYVPGVFLASCFVGGLSRAFWFFCVRCVLGLFVRAGLCGGCAGCPCVAFGSGQG